jgi:hypothetical protein
MATLAYRDDKFLARNLLPYLDGPIPYGLLSPLFRCASYNSYNLLCICVLYNSNAIYRIIITYCTRATRILVPRRESILYDGRRYSAILHLVERMTRILNAIYRGRRISC